MNNSTLKFVITERNISGYSIMNNITAIMPFPTNSASNLTRVVHNEKVKTIEILEIKTEHLNNDLILKFFGGLKTVLQRYHSIVESFGNNIDWSSELKNLTNGYVTTVLLEHANEDLSSLLTKIDDDVEDYLTQLQNESRRISRLRSIFEGQRWQVDNVMRTAVGKHLIWKRLPISNWVLADAQEDKEHCKIIQKVYDNIWTEADMEKYDTTTSRTWKLDRVYDVMHSFAWVHRIKRLFEKISAPHLLDPRVEALMAHAMSMLTNVQEFKNLNDEATYQKLKPTLMVELADCGAWDDSNNSKRISEGWNAKAWKQLIV